MAMHLQGKVARLIGDFRTIHALVELIEHELEKRIVARHGWVKLDSLLDLLPQLKNEYRSKYCAGDKQKVSWLEKLIARLRQDVEGSPISTVRDAMAAHALKLDLRTMDQAWCYMGTTTFGILEGDLGEIEDELKKIAGKSHIPAGSAQVRAEWPEIWRQDGWLGDPKRPRCVTIYPALGTAGIVSPLPGGDAGQDALIRAIGLATFFRQMRIMLEVTEPGSVAERIFAEIMLNDYVSLWELLFESGVRNEYGTVDQSVLDHWNSPPDPWGGAGCLSALRQARHPDFERWRQEVRNRVSAHVDPNLEVWRADVHNWPMSLAELINEALRVIESFRRCAELDIRSKAHFLPPTQFGPDVLGLSAQKGRRWAEA